MKRRHFILGSAVSAVPGAASNRINIGVIGVRGQGRHLAHAFAATPDVEVAWLVDVDEGVLGTIASGFEQKFGKRPKLTGDMRRVFDDQDVHAVAIATPDHWHAPAGILACDAGKDVYVEKPCAHNLREGRLLVEAARRNRRIVQHGTQGRSNANTRRAIEYAHSGKLGRVLMAKAWNTQMRRGIGHKPDSDVPRGVDYDTWTGPAPAMPFNENRFHYTWHWHHHFGTGDMGNDGVHQLDQARWALGVDYPLEVSGMGRKLFFDDDQQFPDTMAIAFNYPEKTLLFEMRIWNPYGMEGGDNCVAVYGSEGMLQTGRFRDGTGFKVFDRAGKLVLFDTEQGGGESHQQDFADCVRTRRAPNAEIEIGYLSSLHCHLGNIVARTGRAIRFDPKAEMIRDDAEANALLGREYRKHWATPRT